MKHRLALLLAAAFVTVTVAPYAHAATDQQRQFMAHANEYAGLGTDKIYNPETQQTLGDAVCADLARGNSAANEVIGVSRDTHLTMSQAEVVVYWAITDLCSQQMSQRQDHWRDGS